MKRRGFILIMMLLSGAGAAAQEADTLDATVFSAAQEGNYLSKGKELRTEVISSAGLMKMACCNLAESFENSASVTVEYSDATTGARQIRLLGLSGVYTSMWDENRPVLRGLSSPFGLSYIPGPWLESIQIAKGSPSVINGAESMTGQINMEHRKPTDGKPLFLQASVMTDSKTDFNIVSSLQVSPQLYTVILGHVDGNFTTHDMNGDGFMDDPKLLQFNVSNRWLYYTPEIQVRWGVRAIRDRREGGQTGEAPGRWTSDITHSSVNGYIKAGKSLREDQSASIAAVGDYTYQKMDALFGEQVYNASEQSGFVNLIYRNRINERHDITLGVNGTWDHFEEDIAAGGFRADGAGATVFSGGPYAEYTFHYGDAFSAIAGFSGSVYRTFKAVPRLTVRWQPSSALVFRLNGGRGLRYSHPVPDHIGILSTGKAILGDLTDRILEDSWTYGGNFTLYLPLGYNPANAYLSFDCFRTDFTRQLLLDKEAEGRIVLYTLDGNDSFSNNYQIDFSVEPLKRFSLNLTARYTDAREWHPDGGVREKPLTHRFKGVLNLQYKTGLGRWIFDFTASVNGPARVYDFMKTLTDETGALLYPHGRTPVYPLLYAQVTRRFRGFDVYAGGENLTGYTQKMPVIGEPDTDRFDAASVWGPLMGAKIYAGIRMTIWKQVK